MRDIFDYHNKSAAVTNARKRKERRTSTIRGCVENETSRARVSMNICKQKKGMIIIHIHASLSAQQVFSPVPLVFRPGMRRLVVI